MSKLIINSLEQLSGIKIQGNISEVEFNLSIKNINEAITLRKFIIALSDNMILKNSSETEIKNYVMSIVENHKNGENVVDHKVEKKRHTRMSKHTLHPINMDDIKKIAIFVTNDMSKAYMEINHMSSEKELNIEDYFQIHEGIIMWLLDISTNPKTRKKKTVKLKLSTSNIKMCKNCFEALVIHFLDMRVYTEMGNF